MWSLLGDHPGCFGEIIQGFHLAKPSKLQWVLLGLWAWYFRRLPSIADFITCCASWRCDDIENQHHIECL